MAEVIALAFQMLQMSGALATAVPAVIQAWNSAANMLTAAHAAGRELTDAERDQVRDALKAASDSWDQKAAPRPAGT